MADTKASMTPPTGAAVQDPKLTFPTPSPVPPPSATAGVTSSAAPQPVREKQSSPIMKVLIVAFVVMDVVLIGYILYKSGMLPLG